jgi:hypothetical protein
MLEDHLVELAPSSPTRVEFRSGARPFGARAMTRTTPQDVTAATREVSEHARVPDRPINLRSIEDILAWRDAHIAQGDADIEREYQADLKALVDKPFGVLGL